MRVLLLSSTYFPPQVGGISRAVEALATSLSPAEVTCVTGVRASRHWPREISAPVFRRPWMFGDVRSWRAAPFAVALTEVIARARPDVALVATADDGYLALWLRRWFGLPFVVMAHGNEVLRALRGERGKAGRALREADQVLAVSRFTRQLLLNGGVDSQRITVSYLGCDADWFRPVPVSSEFRRTVLKHRHDTRVILTIGNLVPRKGHDTIIRALPAIRDAVGDVTYLIVGTGRERERLQALSREVGVEGVVVFGGYVRDDSLAEVYSLCDVFAMPSRERLGDDDVEGLGLVALEAGACSRPVVGGRAGGMPEVIEDGVTGLLTDPRHPEAVAEAITSLLADPVRAAAMGANGRQRVIETFSWAQVGARARRVLEAAAR